MSSRIHPPAAVVVATAAADDVKRRRRQPKSAESVKHEPENVLTPSWDDTSRAAADRIITVVAPLVPALAQMLGPANEVVLHDLTRLPNSIVAIAGSLTGRQVGGPATDLGLRVFTSGWSDNLIGYRTELDDGTVLRSSSLFLKDPTGRPTCCLCINSDIAPLEKASEALKTLLQLSQLSELTGKTEESREGERFPRTIDQLADSILEDAVAQTGIPIELMHKKHKVAVVQELHRRGFFVMRESVDLVARTLHISRYTVYNYLTELGESVGT